MNASIAEVVQSETQPKIDAGEELRAALDRVETCRAELATAERERDQARKKALRAGWKEHQLRRAGLIDKQRRSRTSSAPQAQTKKSSDERVTESDSNA